MAAARRLSLHDTLRQARTWGWLFWAGVSGLVFAGIVSQLVVPRLQRESQAVGADADLVGRRASHAGIVGRDATRLESGGGRFLAAFPAAQARQTRVAALLELAVRHSLTLHRSEFRLGKDKGSGLTRYSVTMPLAGTYAQLRDFVEEALASDAALSLDRLRLRRASAAAPVVEAELTWSFYMRPGADAASGTSR